MRRRLLLLLIALLVIAGHARAKSYSAELYTSELRILEDGTLAVTEIVRMRFERGEFTHLWRTLPLRRLDRIDGIESPDPIRVRTNRQRISIRWEFPALHDTVRTFALSYRVHGVFGNANGRPVLRWVAFPREHAYRIDRARAVLSWPSGWPAPEQLEVSGSDLRPMRSANGALFEIGPLRSERSVTIQAVLAPGTIAVETPAWQVRRQRWDKQMRMMLAIAGVILVLGIFVIVRMRSAAVASAPSSGDLTSRPGPPSDLPAVLAGPVCDGRVWLRHAIAGLIDLGACGVLRFESQPQKSRWSGRTFRIRRLADPATLGTIERAAFESAFRKGDVDGTVDMRKAWPALMRDMKGFERLVRAELEARGEYDPHVAEGGRRIARFGYLLFALCAAAGVLVGLAFDRLGPSAIAAVGVLAILGAVAVGIGMTLPLQSASGRAHAAEWKGFARYMRDAAKGSVPLDAERFHRWLPYATSLGIADAWLRAGKKSKIAPPPWLEGLEGDKDGMAAWLPVFGVSTSGHGGMATGGGGAAGGGGSGAG